MSLSQVVIAHDLGQVFLGSGERKSGKGGLVRTEFDGVSKLRAGWDEGEMPRERRVAEGKIDAHKYSEIM